MLELVGVVLEDPELRGRLLLHVLGRAVHRLVCRPRPPAQSGRSTARPCAPPSWPGPSSASGCTTAMALRSSGRFVRCTASAGSSLSSVANSLPRSVVTTKFPSSPVSSRAARLVARPTVSAFLFCRGSTAASQVKTSITTRPYFVFPRVLMRSACSRSFGPSAADLPSPAKVGSLEMQPGAKLQAYLGVSILQPHACAQRFRLRILRRTRSNAGRTSARSLSGRI